MLSRCTKHFSQLKPLAESILVKTQELSRVPRCPGWSHIVNRAHKNLPRFTARQMIILLHSVSRRENDLHPDERKLVHLCSLELANNMRNLSVKEMALAVNAFAKMRIRNEVFLLNSMDIVLRHLQRFGSRSAENTAPRPAFSLASATALLLSGYTKLGIFGDKSLFRYVYKECLPQWLDTMNEIDAITFLSVAEKSAVTSDGSMMQSLTSKLYSPETLIAGLSVSVKLGGLDDIDHLSAKVVAIVDISSLSLHRLVQGFHGVANSSNPVESFPWFDLICSRMKSASPSIPVGVLMTFLAGISKASESLPVSQSVDVLQWIESEYSSTMDLAALAVLVNTCATINLRLSPCTRARINYLFDSRASETCSSSLSRSLSVVGLALSKLDEPDLLYRVFLGFNERKRDLLRVSSPQSVESLLLSAVWLRDVSERDPRFTGLGLDTVLATWITTLSNMCRNEEMKLPARFTQGKIIGALMGDAMIGKETYTGASKVSGLQAQVADTVSAIQENAFTMNAIDATTGYEMDLFLGVPL